MVGIAEPTELSSFLGLARRAGALAVGGESVRHAVRSGEAKVVLIAADAAPRQAEKVTGTARGRGIPVYGTAMTRDELGRVLGASPLTSVAVTGESFAKEIVRRCADLAEDGEHAEERR